MFAVHAAVWLAAAASPPATSCDTAVIGGGWAGVYAAWRLVVDSSSLDPADVCLFEARSAVGGRTYTVDVGPLTVDVGAYRFGKNMHLPGDLIDKALNLSTTCYEPDCKPDAEFNQVLYRIVDDQGHNAGYATPLRVMVKQLSAAGVRIFYHHELTGIYDDDTHDGASGPPANMLHFAGGAVASARAVLLNLPRVVVERLDPASSLFVRDHTALPFQILRNCTPCSDGKQTKKQIQLGVKVYAMYDDPWWITKLGLKEGSFNSVETDPPLVGRYHDGPVRHDASGAIIGPGALEAVYSYSVLQPQISWYAPFAADIAADPLTITTDSALLDPLHAKLMAVHAAAFAKVGMNTSQVPRMSQVVLGIWSDDQLAQLPQPMSANMHVMAKSPLCPAEPCLQGLTPPQYNDIVANPNSKRDIHIANNDYAWTGFDDVPCCWAEQSLRSVERTLHSSWSLPKPKWLDEAYYAQVIANK